MLQAVDLTTALRPSLLPDETLLFVQDAVGLYGGRAKLADYQNGQAYLTSHRICYVDNALPRERAVAVDLRDVERCELSARFLKSSPKITLIPKTARFGSSAVSAQSAAFNHADYQPSNRTPSGIDHSIRPVLKDATWICPICSFSNPLPPTFDPSAANANTPISPCQACGIKPPPSHVVKAAISNLSSQKRASNSHFGINESLLVNATSINGNESSTQCPRCTFQNHPSLTICEICGSPLNSTYDRKGAVRSESPSRSSSPAIAGTNGLPSLARDDEVKLSFRAGGEKNFHERLQNALTQRKWLLQTAPPVPKINGSDAAQEDSRGSPNRLGIAGLERRGVDLRKNNEMVIGNAFEDLAALMASAKEIIALAESLSRSQGGSYAADSSPSQSSTDPNVLLSQLNLSTTKDMLSSSKSSATNLYLTELCRSIAEFLTDDRRSVLKKAGGVMSLVDLWAVFNRARGGVELVSPSDFAAAAELFDKLSLPVRLRRFKSGLLVVQDRSRTDEKTISALLEWLGSLRHTQPEMSVTWDWSRWGRGVTAQETAENFGWSIGVASEELEMAEENGSLCRESGIEGVRFWENQLGQAEIVDFEAVAEARKSQAIERNLEQLGLA